MRQEEYIESLVKDIEARKIWDRVIAIDLETDCRNKDFLSNERILAIGVAYFKEDKKINFQIFRLEEDSDESEVRLLQEFDEFLRLKHPLVVTGFHLRQYDVPLLALKKSYYSKKKIVFWKIGNLIDNTFHFELSSYIQDYMKNRCDEKFQRWSLERLVNHKCFETLPLLRSKSVIENDVNKGEEIYNLWKNRNPIFEEYLKGDVHDPLILMHEIFKE